MPCDWVEGHCPGRPTGKWLRRAHLWQTGAARAPSTQGCRGRTQRPVAAATCVTACEAPGCLLAGAVSPRTCGQAPGVHVGGPPCPLAVSRPTS